jgi:prevent-host-death family protein
MTIRVWPAQEAEARFTELLETCLRDGPQLITRRAVEAAVLVPVAEWRRLSCSSKPTLKELLLTDTARGDLNIPSRRRWRRRKAHAPRG